MANGALSSFVLQHEANAKNILYKAVCTSDMELLRDTLKSSPWMKFQTVKIFLETSVFTSARTTHRTYDDWSALHLAVYLGRTDMVLALIEEFDARIDSRSIVYLLTPLVLAVAKGHHHLMNLLLSYGADPNDGEGR